MSIFLEFEVGSRGWRFRRAVDSDKYDIERIWCKEHTAPLFGDVDIGSLIELSTLAICLLDEKKNVTGFMALCDRPNVPAVDPSCWEVWMRNMFHKYYLARSTLFIHFMCCTPEVIDYFMEEALVSVFRNDAYLQIIVIVVPPYCSQEVILRYKTFKHLSIQKYQALANLIEEYEQGLHIYVATRQEFCPRLKIRRAVEEDNDDIVAILDKHSQRLREMYGDFYISEILGRHPESQREIIVSESRDRVTGVMCLNATVNCQKLQKTYELQPYHWLIKATPLEKEQYKRTNTILQVFGHPIMDGKWSPYDSLLQLENYENESAGKRRSGGGRRSVTSRSNTSSSQDGTARKDKDALMESTLLTTYTDFKDGINEKQISRSSLASKAQENLILPTIVCQTIEEQNTPTSKKTPMTPKIGKENIQHLNVQMTPKSNLLCTPTRLTRSALKLNNDGFATPRAPLSANKANVQRQNTGMNLQVKTTPNNLSRSKTHSHLIRAKNLPPLI